ncbi:MAG: hypothetical protein ACKO9Q_22730, partial [Pirellula sp.]
MTRSPNAFLRGSMLAPSLCLLFLGGLVGCATDPMRERVRLPRDTTYDSLISNESEQASTPGVVSASHNA